MEVRPFTLMLVSCALCLPPPSALCAPAGIQALASPVMDQVGLVDAESKRLLVEFSHAVSKEAQGLQIVYYLVGSLNGRERAEYATEVFNAWKLGSGERDNGILVLIAVKERQYFTATGAGIEGALPDSLLGELQRQYLVPYLQTGEAGKGLRKLTFEMARELKKEYPGISERTISILDIAGLEGGQSETREAGMPCSSSEGCPSGEVCFMSDSREGGECRPGQELPFWGQLLVSLSLFGLIGFLVIFFVLRKGAGTDISGGSSSGGGGWGGGSSDGGGWGGGGGSSRGGGAGGRW